MKVAAVSLSLSYIEGFQPLRYYANVFFRNLITQFNYH